MSQSQQKNQPSAAEAAKAAAKRPDVRTEVRRGRVRTSVFATTREQIPLNTRMLIQKSVGFPIVVPTTN